MASTIISTVTATITAQATASSVADQRAASQGGIIEGENPSKYDSKNPIIIFIIQAGIIIIFTRLLHFPLSKMRQPRVIAEIVGGILLGPSVFGRIPGFSDAIFPKASMPTLSLAANVGLVLFLFLVGLEVDLRLLVSNWRIALSVGAAGMALPFGLGCAIAYGLYHRFREESGLVPISFGTYALFVGVAMAITAFPVLCRILTELKLLQNQVGVVVLSAGVGNDVVGWVLLALCVALVNAGSGITALYVLLTAVGYVLFLVYAVRPAFLYILKRTGSIQNGPTQGVVALTILMTLTSAFFTGIIGVHPIFGAFLIGLICPHDGGFAIKLTEKIEDLVSVFFLPLYFALSGLSTNIGLLDNGITWAYVIGVIAVAFFGKVIGGTIAARLNKMVWRESLTVGALMSCKGLVELIVLNIGLSAKILSQRTFTIFVVMALVTTFATTPLVSALYPPWYQKKLAAWKRGEIDWDGNRLIPDSGSDDAPQEKHDSSEIRRLLVYLRLDSLPSLFTFISLLGPDKASDSVNKVHPRKTSQPGSGDQIPLLGKPLEVHGLRMFELTERLSSVMKESEVDDFSTKDPVVNAFHTFGQLNNVATSGEVQIIPSDSFAETLNGSASEQASDLILLPWSEAGSLSESGLLNPHHGTSTDQFGHGSHSEFVKNFLADAPCNAAVFINNGFGGNTPPRPKPHQTTTGTSIPPTPHLATMPIQNRSHHIFFPFSGGADDRVALRFVLRLARNPNVTATIIFAKRETTSTDDDSIRPAAARPASDTLSPHPPKSAINIVAESVNSSISPSSSHDLAFFSSLRDSLPPSLAPRVSFELADAGIDVISRAKADFEACADNAGNIFVAGRGGNGNVPVQARNGGLAPEAGIILGGLAAAVLEKGVGASLCVMRAAGRGLEM